MLNPKERREYEERMMAERRLRESEGNIGIMLRIVGYIEGTDTPHPGYPGSVEEWLVTCTTMSNGPRLARGPADLTWEELEVMVRTAYANGKKSCSES